MKQIKDAMFFEHMWSFHEFDEGTDHPVYCQVCCEVISGQAYTCKIPAPFTTIDLGYFCFHKSCAELPVQIEHPLHPQHPLRAKCEPNIITHASIDGFICDGCRHYSLGFYYSCKDCGFALDVQCVTKRDLTQPALKEKVDIDPAHHQHELEHFYHRKLLPTPLIEDLVCCCCAKDLPDSAYACIECCFFVNKSCLDKIFKQVSTQVQRPIHSQYPLQFCQLGDVLGNFSCRACGKAVTDLGFCCKNCKSDYNFHVSCCLQAAQGLKLENHEHGMYLDLKEGYHEPEYICGVCEGTCQGFASYRCPECDVNIHIECIPLPRVVKHECHPYHVLTLVKSAVLKNGSDNYRCDVCEEEGDLKHQVYSCEECFYNAHIDCVFSKDDPPLEILEYLIPRSRDESGKETEDKAEQQSNTEEEQERDVEDCSLEEMDKKIERAEEEMEKLAFKLEVLQDKHA